MTLKQNCTTMTVFELSRKLKADGKIYGILPSGTMGVLLDHEQLTDLLMIAMVIQHIEQGGDDTLMEGDIEQFEQHLKKVDHGSLLHRQISFGRRVSVKAPITDEPLPDGLYAWPAEDPGFLFPLFPEGQAALDALDAAGNKP